MTKHGSALAIFKDGNHRAVNGIFDSFASFKSHIADVYREQRYNIAFFVYGWGTEHQEYTPGEVREMFFHE
jgi:hypothetical protein